MSQGFRFVEMEDRHRADWETLAAEHPAAGFMQSWSWSRFKEIEGYNVLRLGLFEGSKLRGGGIVYAFPSPAEAGLVNVPDGPLLDWNEPKQFEAFVADVRRRLASACLLRVEPRLETPPEPLTSFPRAPIDLVPDQSWMIQLGEESRMLAAMKPKGRYNAKLALRRGVTVSFSSDPADIHDFHFILDQTARYQGFQAEPKSFFINLARALFPGSARLAFARYKGVILAAALLVEHGRTLTYLYGGHLPLFRATMANYGLHWEIMRDGARRGHRAYDLYGFVPKGHSGHPYDSFSRFKEKLGGSAVVRVGSRDVLFYDRLAEAALKVMENAL